MPVYDDVSCSMPVAASSLAIFLASTAAVADLQIGGIAVDLNGRPLPQAQVTVRTGESHRGADYITVFAGPDGRFVFPEPVATIDDDGLGLEARVLGYEQVSVLAESAGADTRDVTIVMRAAANQAAVAPASAWLAGIEDRPEKALYVQNCAGCHQAPSPAVRSYAAQIAAVPSDRPDEVRRQSWLAIAKEPGRPAAARSRLLRRGRRGSRRDDDSHLRWPDGRNLGLRPGCSADRHRKHADPGIRSAGQQYDTRGDAAGFAAQTLGG